MKNVTPKLFTASGIVTAKDAALCGLQVGVDGINDVTLTVYHGTSAAQGNELVPTMILDGTKKILHGGVWGYEKDSPGGMYIEINCAGSCEVILDVGWK